MPIYKDEERGTWYSVLRYTDASGRVIQKKKRGFKLKRDAEKWEREYIRDHQDNANISFERLCNLYLQDCEARLKLSTYQGKKYLLERKLIPYFGKYPINEITPLQIRRWQNKMIQQDYKASYLRKLQDELSAAFNHAVMYYSLKENPCKKCGSIAKPPKAEMDFWTVDEFKQFIDAIDKEHHFEVYVMAMILFWSGMRHGELLAITPNDIDFENNIIGINKTYRKVVGEHVIQSPKTNGSYREITVPKAVIDLIAEYIKKTDRQANERLFEYSHDMFRKQLYRICEKNNIKKIRVHDLRHSHASYLINNGFSALVVKERLGHENIKITLQTYSHLYDSTKVQVIEMMEKDIDRNLLP